MILYQTAYSSVSCKLRVGLALKGLSLPVEPPPGGSTASPAFRALVPAGTVPALVDGGLVLTESDAILEYLEELHPAAPLLPGPPALRARARMLSRLHDFRIDLPLRVLYGQIRLVQRDETRVAETFARLADGLALIATLADPDGPFLLGPTPTLADCAWPANLQWLAAMADAFDVPLSLPPRLEILRTALTEDHTVAGAMAGYAALVSAWVVGARR